MQQLVAMTYNNEEEIITITFTDNLEPFLVLFPDAKYLIDNCQKQEENTVTVSKETLQNYITRHRTIPILITLLIEENLPRIEYAFNYIIQLLENKLGVACKKINQLHSRDGEQTFDLLKVAADAIIQKASKNELRVKVDADLRDYKLRYKEGFIHDDGRNGF